MRSFDDFTEDDQEFLEGLKTEPKTELASERDAAIGTLDNFSNLRKKASNLTKAFIIPALAIWFTALSITTGSMLVMNLTAWSDWMNADMTNLGFKIFVASSILATATVGIHLKAKNLIN